MQSEQTIFLAALEIESPAERSAYLDKACGHDTDMRRRLAALLKAHVGAGSFLDLPVVEQVRGHSKKERSAIESKRDSLFTTRILRRVEPPTGDRPKASPAIFHTGRWLVGTAAVLLLVAGLSISETTGVTHLRGAALRFFTQHGSLVVEVDDPGVSVVLDGEEVVITGAGPKEIRLKPGAHELHANRDGQSVLSEIINIQRGGRTIVRIRRDERQPRKSFEADLELAVRAARGKLAAGEHNELAALEHRIVRQLADPSCKKLMHSFADLPDAMHDSLKKGQYLKWKHIELEPAMRLAFAAVAGNEVALKTAHVGFAVVDVKPPPPPDGPPHRPGPFAPKSPPDRHGGPHHDNDGPPPHNGPPARIKILVWYTLPADDAAVAWGVVVGPKEMDEAFEEAASRDVLAQLRTLRTRSNTSLPERMPND